MTRLDYVATLTGEALAFLGGIRDLEGLEGDGRPVLQSASGALGGTTLFDLAEGEVARFASQAAYPTFTRSFVGALHGGSVLSIPLVRLNMVLDQADRGQDGRATSAQVFLKNTGFAGAEVQLLAVELGGTAFVYAGLNGFPGIACYRMTSATTMVLESLTADKPASALADVAAMASARVGGHPLLFSASAGENGITSFRIRADGSLQQADVVGVAQALFIATPTVIEPVVLGGETFLLVAAAGSSSLSVLAVDDTGQMRVVDHIIDSLETRFGNVTVLETVTVGDRVFILAAGSDDGLALLTLLPGGRLLHLASLADSDAMTLTNISALTAARVGAELQVFAASYAEPGITQFRIDLADLGAVVQGSATANTLAGGPRDDVLAGRSGDDQMSGGVGDDLLMDGAGLDRLTGGAGADRFVMSFDGQTDRILDFQPGVDRLDLSAWPMLYGAGQLSIVSTAQGARLRYGSEVLEVLSASGAPLGLADFGAEAILNLQRPAGSLDGPGVSLQGSRAADLMIGAGGDDVFSGSAGGDWVMAGLGTDIMQFGSSSAGVRLDLKAPERNRGEADGDGYDGVEVFRGTRQADRMSGDAGANSFLGSDGNDWLRGRGGLDDLQGGAGADRLVGGKGADRLTGGGLADRFVYGARAESLPGAGNRDLITDFGQGADLVDLEGIDANRQRSGNQSFDFIGKAAFSGKAGELRVIRDTAQDRTLVQANITGDGRPDWEIELAGLVALQSDDFLL